MSTVQLNWCKPSRHAVIKTYYCTTLVGPLSIHMQASLLSKIEWLDDSREPFDNTPMQLEQILQHYWHHAMIDYSHPLLKQGTAFQQKVWQALCGIPAGQTRTYGELAQTLNTSPRALANACRNNPFPIIIPCHRVVSKTGIGGYAGHTSGPILAIKYALLQHEKMLTHEL